MNDYPLINAGRPDSDDEALGTSKRKSSGAHASEWLVNVADDVVLPMVTSEVVEALRAGRIDSRSLVWRIGMSDWSALDEVPQLRLAAGPSALPAAASTPGPIVHKSLAVPAEQRRRSTLPMGLPVVREPVALEPAGVSADSSLEPLAPGRPSQEDPETPAGYEVSVSSLAFSDSGRDDWQGAGPPVNATSPGTAPVPPGHRRLTPVPPVPAKVPDRQASLAQANALAPSEAKQTSKRLVLWAGIASAVIAAVFTLRFVGSPTPQAVPPGAAPHRAAALDAAAVATQTAAVATQPVTQALPLASAVSSAAVLAAATAPASAAAAAPVAKPKLATRHVKPAKPALPLAVDTPTTDSSAEASDSPSAPTAASPPSAVPTAKATATGPALTAQPEAPRPSAAPVPAPTQ